MEISEALCRDLKQDKNSEIKSLTKSMNKTGRINGNIIDAKTLIDKIFPEPKVIVPGLIYEGVHIFAGRPKLGKTWIALDIATAASSGGRVFGKIKVEKGLVLYLALEDGARRLQKRLKYLFKDGEIPEGLFLATDWLPLYEGGLDKLEKWLQDNPDTRLIVIDTLKRIRPSDRVNSRLYDNDYDAIAPLNDLAHKYDVAILVVHHTRKAPSNDPLDLVSGSFGLTGAADGILVLKRGSAQAEVTLQVISRDFEEKELALRWDKEINGWILMGSAEDYIRSEERQTIINFLYTQLLPVSPLNIAKALNRKHNATKKLLRSMVHDGELISNKGLYSINGGNSGNSVTEEDN